MSCHKFSTKIYQIVYIQISISDVMIEAGNSSDIQDLSFNLTNFEGFLEIHRTNFSGANKIQFHSDKMPCKNLLQVIDIDHVYCHNGSVCEIKICCMSECKESKQEFDPKDKVRTLESTLTQNAIITSTETIQNLTSYLTDASSRTVHESVETSNDYKPTTKSSSSEAVNSPITKSTTDHSKGSKYTISNSVLLIFAIAFISFTLRIDA